MPWLLSSLRRVSSSHRSLGVFCNLVSGLPQIWLQVHWHPTLWREARTGQRGDPAAAVLPALWQQKAPAEHLLRTNMLVMDGGVHVTAAIHEPRAASTTTREGMGKQRPLNQLRLLGVADQP